MEVVGEKIVMDGGGGGLICTFASVSLHTILLYFNVFICIKVVDVCVGVVCETSKRARERRRENDKTVASASAKENTVILTILCYTLSQVSTKRI